MQTTIDIDNELLSEAKEYARRKGLPLSAFVEQALRDSLRTEQPGAPQQVYGAPLTDEDIEESARVTFRMLDQDEKDTQPR